ncbi:MAG TPA: hypothetical protein VF740_01730 [Candidatus Acidoferrum sp.]
MALIVPCGSFPKKVLRAAACVFACAWVVTPVAFGQRGGHVGGGHAGVGGHAGGGHVVAPNVVVPPSSHVAIPHAPVVLGPRPGFGQRPIFIRHRVFLRPPFFRWRVGFYPWWLNCGPAWVWGFGCGDWRLPEYEVENYVVPPPAIYEYPVYVPYGGERDLVLLFLQDGTVYSVSDYWFVNDQVHFTVLDDGGTKSVEQVIGVDELDLQRTIDVNTRRGFRFVRRDEPLEQYLRDHPEANPPLFKPPPKN